MKIFFRNFSLIFLAAAEAAGAEVSASGNWSEIVTAANLSHGAGTNIQSSLESTTGLNVLTIANVSGRWRLKARRSPGRWDSHLSIWVKRTSDGAGSGTIAGGSNYVELGANDVELFCGSGARGSISLQYRLTGLTTAVPPNSYTSSIIFTVQ